MFKYLIHQTGQEIYRTDRLPILRDGEDWLALDADEFETGLMLRLTTGQRHTLNTLRAEKRLAINVQRNSLEQGGFEYLGKTIDSDAVSVQRITIAVQAAQAALAAGQPFVIDWTCADGSVLPLDAAGVIGMPVALALHACTLHADARAKKAAIDAATTLEELEAIV